MVEASFLFIREGYLLYYAKKLFFIQEVIKMKEVNTKDIRKIAFAIGFGLTLGKLTASALNTVINSGIRGLIKELAKSGNKQAQHICNEANIQYVTLKGDETKDKVEMGFHC